MSRKLYLSVILLIMVSLIIGFGTLAFFTSSSTNSSNKFSTEKVIFKLERDLGDRIPGPMFYTTASDPNGRFPYNKSRANLPGGEAIGGWAPGDTITRAINLYNVGSIDAKVSKLRANANPQGETSGEAYNEFINMLNIKVMFPANNIVLYNGPLSGLLNQWVNITPMEAYAGGGALNLTFEAHLSPAAGNRIQGKNYVFDFSLWGDQL